MYISACHGQYYCPVLCEQARRHSFSIPSIPHHWPMGMVLPASHLPDSNTYRHGRKLHARLPQLPDIENTWIVFERHHLWLYLSLVGHPDHRCLYLQRKCQVLHLLLLRQSRREFHWRCIHDRLGHGSTLPVPTSTTHIKNNYSTPALSIECNPSSSLVTKATVVQSPQIDVGRIPASTDSWPSHTGRQDGYHPDIPSMNLTAWRILPP